MTTLSCGLIFSLAVMMTLGNPGMAQTQEIQPEPSGRSEALNVGILYIPEGFTPTSEGIDLTLHLQGSARVAQHQFDISKRSGVLVSVVLRGLSNVYRDQFKDPKIFWQLLNEVRERFKKDGIEPPIRTVTIVSFSAGFGAVRELLKNESIYKRIDALIMLDSIHTGYVDDDLTTRKIPEDQMASFLAFARDAVEGRKRLIVSYSEVKPPNYASTKETAHYLLEAVNGKLETTRETWTPKLTLTSRFQKGQFKLFGFAGETGEDHMQHLYEMSRFWNKL